METTELEAGRINAGAGGRISVKISNQIIDPQNVTSLIVREWALDHWRVPRLEIVVQDDGLLSDWDLPFQGTIIEIDIIKDKSDDLEESELITLAGNYKVVDFSFTKSAGMQAGAGFDVTLTALLDIPSMFTITPNVAYTSTTSLAVLQSIADDLELDFITNIDSTADSMNWLCVNTTPIKFIQHVVERSYITDGDATLCFIGKNSTLNYISFNSSFDGEAIPCKYNTKMTFVNTVKETIREGIKLGLEEEEAASTIWYSSFSLKGSANSSEIMNGGFLNSVKTLDIQSGNWMPGIGSEQDNGDQALTEVIVDNHTNLVTGEIDPNETSFKSDRVVYNGILPGVRTTTENVYGDEYYYSKTNRKNVLSGFLGSPITIEVNPNIPLAVGNILDLEAPASAPIEGSPTAEIHDGQYIVLGLIYMVDNGMFKKIASIHRVGYNVNPNI
jgi:hypothetical protein